MTQQTELNKENTNNKPCDPRVFFAAERTLLAWLRTGLTIIAIGFMISRFGLFLQLIGLQAHTNSSPIHVTESPIAAGLGIAFVVIGSLAITSASIQHLRFIKSLSQQQLPTGYASKSAALLAFLIALLGIALASYLWMT